MAKIQLEFEATIQAPGQQFQEEAEGEPEARHVDDADVTMQIVDDAARHGPRWKHWKQKLPSVGLLSCDVP